MIFGYARVNTSDQLLLTDALQFSSCVEVAQEKV